MTDTADQKVREREYGFDTLALHAGLEVDSASHSQFSVGLESIDDILYDLDQALNGA